MPLQVLDLTTKIQKGKWVPHQRMPVVCVGFGNCRGEKSSFRSLMGARSVGESPRQKKKKAWVVRFCEVSTRKSKHLKTKVYTLAQSKNCSLGREGKVRC